MKFINTNIEGVFIIVLEPHKDERGMFSRIYCKNEFQSISADKDFVQVNYSFTLKKGTIRGLHFQSPPKQESKIVKCISGKVFDVVVDIRKNSRTYLKWIPTELSKENMKMIYIPEGCAHGFQTLEDNCEMLYFHSEFYSPEYERTIYFDNKQININWPLDVTEISERDIKAREIFEDLGV
ncbi:MAG: dTDP-4-dehydrorhamnose 3,5-epimerase [Bacteroidetes bacterium]|nr:dTDP-4-dehydrorhamnose 3,5-epimerase [Bacteroidota bacterium]